MPPTLTVPRVAPLDRTALGTDACASHDALPMVGESVVTCMDTVGGDVEQPELHVALRHRLAAALGGDRARSSVACGSASSQHVDARCLSARPST